MLAADLLFRQLNAYALVDSLEEAEQLARRYSAGGAEPGSYYVAEVLEGT